MTSCSCRPYVKRNTNVDSDPYKTSYERSYFYENAVDHPLIHVRVNRRARDDLKVQDPIVLKTLESVSQATFVPKYLEACNSTDFHRRSSVASKPTLKALHEKYIKDPPRPPKSGSTTAGSAYVSPEKIYEAKIWPRQSPIEEFTFPISSHSKEGSPSFLPNESGYGKHLDPYISTTQLAHCNFSEEQRNGVARKNIMTFYDGLGLPKNRGFGPKKLVPFGSYFHRDEIAPQRVHAAQTPCVPFFGKTSTYRSDYEFVPTNLMHTEEKIFFPAIYKPIEEISYCTEQCHTGTGWPVRGSLNIGTVQGTH